MQVSALSLKETIVRDNRLNWKKGGWGTAGLQIPRRVITWFQKKEGIR